ncbi:annexin-like protein RJ4 [Rutidosis leptorrhynchoides]|uniref:annexin-like protein RJ4 n=1 Tax=Rutidosis leptorrhynchoides TaxID=125765 RepID=UPI003A9A36EE
MATLVAPQEFSPVEDAELLHKAVKGWGTDEKAIIRILAHRNAGQRQQIRAAYHQLHNEDLLKRLESELSGDFEKAVYRWVLDPYDRDAVLAYVAVRKSNPTDYHVLVEIACILNSEELLAVRRAYQLRYKHSLEEDVASHTSGDLRKLLVGLLSVYRYDGNEINPRLAEKEAGILHEALKDKQMNHEEVIRIVTTRSKTQLMAIFNCYRDHHGTSITKSLGGSHDEFANVLRTAIRCINDHKKYYEKMLRNAIKRVGTDEDALTRVIVSRAEKDLREIKEVYYKRNSVTLDQAVSMDTSGDYKAFLLALLGKED